jgi:hypothetical protein
MALRATKCDENAWRAANLGRSRLYRRPEPHPHPPAVQSGLFDAPLFRTPVPGGRTAGPKLEPQVMVDKIMAIPRNRITGRASQRSSPPFFFARCQLAHLEPLMGIVSSHDDRAGVPVQVISPPPLV